MKRAFTLIELLVVIAIIAILAAILFPVFASAKAAAKTTAGVSNIKQMGTSVVLYQGDYDDAYPLAAYPTKPDFSEFKLWHDLLDPYLKNKGVWHCPGSSVKTQDSNGTITSHWGYNLLYLTTFRMDFSNAIGHTAVSQSSIENAADTIVFTSARSSKPNSWCGDDGKMLMTPSISASMPQGADCWGVPDLVHLESAVVAWSDTHANRRKMTQFFRGQEPADRFFDLQ